MKSKWVQERIAKGICVDCSNPAKTGCRRCQACLQRSANWSKRNKDRVNNYPSKKAWYQKFKDEGKCHRCGSDRTGISNYCFKCYLKHVALTLIIDGKRTNKHWKALLEIFGNQQGKCPYTGRELIIGLNAELDHIVPRCLDGSDAISNLQWVFQGINRMKGAMSEEDFLNLVKETHQHRLMPTS